MTGIESRDHPLFIIVAIRYSEIYNGFSECIAMDKNTTVQLEGGEVGSVDTKEYGGKQRTAEEKLGLDIFHKPYSKIKSMSTWMKIHWMVAIIVNIVCVFGMVFL